MIHIAFTKLQDIHLMILVCMRIINRLCWMQSHKGVSPFHCCTKWKQLFSLLILGRLVQELDNTRSPTTVQTCTSCKHRSAFVVQFYKQWENNVKYLVVKAAPIKLIFLGNTFVVSIMGTGHIRRFPLKSLEWHHRLAMFSTLGKAIRCFVTCIVHCKARSHNLYMFGILLLWRCSQSIVVI